MLVLRTTSRNDFRLKSAIRGLKMSQVVAELIEQWLLANETYSSKVGENAIAGDKVAK